MRLEMDRFQRWYVGVVLPMGLLAVTALPTLLRRGDLPDPIATHFGAEGEADGSMPLALHLGLTLAVASVAAAVLVWSARSSPPSPGR